MSLASFLQKQFIDVVQWNEPEEGITRRRYPFADMRFRRARG